MKKVFISGASGFIGKNLVEKLKDSYNIYAPNRNELNLFDFQKVSEYLQKEKFDIIIHAANVNATRNKVNSSYNVLDGNLRMFFNLESCNDYFGKLYYFGSGAEYDREHYIPNMKEDYFGNNVPQDAYGFSKYIMSKYAASNSNIYDLRLFGVYGKYEEYERRFISNAICRALMGREITIQKNVYFDYLYIEDLADIMRWFIEHEPKYHHYNVCRGSKIDLYSLAVMVRGILGIDCDIVVAEEGWKKEYTGDNSRLTGEMGKYSFTDFEESIENLCNWYKENWDKIDKSIID